MGRGTDVKSDIAGTIKPASPAVDRRLSEYQRDLDSYTGLNKVGNKTHSVVGFGGNINFIEGDGGIIVVNTGTSLDLSRQVLAMYRAVSDKPIVAVIYTHGYSDHTGGARVFVPEGEEERVAVYASAVWPGYARQAGSPVQPEVIIRAASQLGWLLPEGPAGTVGNGLTRPIRGTGGSGYVKPTVSVAAPTRFTIAGVTLEMIPAPHDVDDGMIVWMPDERILFGGDLLLLGGIYPPLATPRFEPRRDPQAWIQSMALAASYAPDHIINAYGKPISGASEVAALLRGQQRISQYMVDDVYRRILRGENADEIAARFAIPASVSGDCRYVEIYHRLAWVIRSLISREFGHLSGDVIDLVRFPPAETARRLAAEIGGVEEVASRAAEAYKRDDPRWALELSTIALRAEHTHPLATAVRRESLRAIAFASDSANERNYLLTAVAMETGEIGRAALLRAIRGTAPVEVALLKPPAQMLNILGPKLRQVPGRPALSVGFRITDRDDLFRITILDSVMLRDVAMDDSRPDLMLTLDHASLIRGIEGMDSFSELTNTGAVRVEGAASDLDRFIAAFDWNFEDGER